MFTTILLAALVGADPETAAPASPRAVIGGDETAMVGQIAELTAADSERAKSYKWLIRPKPTSVKNAKPDGSAIYVSNRSPGIFEVELVVSSAEGQIDVAIGELEIVGDASADASGPGAAVHQSRVSAQVSDVSNVLSMLRELHAFEQTLGPQPPQPAAPMALGMVSPGMPTAAMVGHPPQRPENAVTWPEGIKVLAHRVASNTRAAEGVIVSGCFRSVANQIKTGTFSGNDPWKAANLQAREALGQAYVPWQQFFANLSILTNGLKGQGLIATPQSSVLLLESAAEALSHL